ncbi:MAG: hypothetical protein Q8Q15_03420 [bacterium]|nr:hypothetical protein [bacterium]
MSLTTKDKKDISKIIDQALTKYAKDLIKPSFELVFQKLDKHDKRFDKVEKELSEVKSQVNSMDRKLDLVAEKVTDHDRKLARLESLAT